MTVKIDEDNLAKGVVGLVVALAEIIRDALKLQAVRRIETGRLTDEEIDRLGNALLDLDKALESMKKEHGINEVTQNIRDSLDSVVDDILDKFINPKRWSDDRLLANARRWAEQERRANPIAVKNG